jgi:hypothetical protein
MLGDRIRDISNRALRRFSFKSRKLVFLLLAPLVLLVGGIKMSNEIIKSLWNSAYFQTTFSQPPDAGSLGGAAIPDTTSVPDNDYSL